MNKNQPSIVRTFWPWPLAILAALLLQAAGQGLAAQPAHPSLPFSNLVLVDEILCGDPADPHHTAELFKELPAGVSQVQTILGRACRVLPNPVGAGSRYFAYRIGQNKGLVAGRAYVLEIDYPEDAPRTVLIVNNGETSARGFHTGRTLGDAFDPPYVVNNAESLDMPLANGWRTWTSLFHLHDRFHDLVRPSPKVTSVLPFGPADGFWVIVAHYRNLDEPLSQGAAVAAIRLYEAPSFESYAAPIQFPPAGLPRRYLFTREEMADGQAGIFSGPVEARGVAQAVDWFEYKARQMRFLGINVFAKDLLEFGNNQGFDPGPGGGANWYFGTPRITLWDDILAMLRNYDLDILPYYEYAGSKGYNGLGNERRAKPLNPNLSMYTSVAWAEEARADITDPDTLEDARLLLDTTMTRFRDARFIGAWFRARTSALPISFSDANIAQFIAEARHGDPITRTELRQSATAYHQYKQWWYGMRLAFINAMRDHLRRQRVGEDPALLFTIDCSEPGRPYTPPFQPELIAENGGAWSAAGLSSVPLTQALQDQRHLKAMTLRGKTWSGWEWHHAEPEADPATYAGNAGGQLTLTFNKAYTVSDPALLDLFRAPSGLAIVRHFALNEDTLAGDPLGYYVSDVERTGPHVMMGEALAMANGDPRYIGYLSSTTFGRGFPQYVRAFNQAFLALPAVPSIRSASSSSDPDVIVRIYNTDGFGTWLGVVNTARTDQSATITLPGLGNVTDAATGATLAANAASISLDLYPFQLRALHFDARSATGAVAAADSAQTNEGAPVLVSVLANDTGGSLSLSGVGDAPHGSAQIVGSQVRYTPDPGFFGTDSFRYTVSNANGSDTARVTVTVLNTEAAADLAGWGLQARTIGVSGPSQGRLLAGGAVGEVRGSGAGMTGNADGSGFLWRSVAGNFTATVRLNGIAGADALAGLMVRSDWHPSAAMAWIGKDPSNILRYGSRTRFGEEAGAGVGPAAAGPVWLRLQRDGSRITLSRSSDGSAYAVIGTRVLPGLPGVARLGLFTHGGEPPAPARALFQDFTVTASALPDQIFFQDFSSSNQVAAYVSATPDAGQFNSISAEIDADPDGWQIVDGALALDALGIESPNNDAGLVRTTPFAGPPSFVRVSFDLSARGMNVTSDIFFLELGNFPTVTDFNAGTGGNSNHAYRVAFKGSLANSFTVRVNGQASPVNLAGADGWHAVQIFYNGTAAAVDYTGPDGLPHVLDSYCGAVWVGATLASDNILRDTNFAAAPRNLRIRFPVAQLLRIRLDNMMVCSSPGADDPGGANQAPAAAADAASLAEDEIQWIDVLANDSDPDNGPQGLHLTGASTAGGGTVEISGKGVLYRPAVGFLGHDSFTYTVSDGVSTDTGTVSVTVNSVAVASDLTGEGLVGAQVGAASSGSSRILPYQVWEVTGTGSGITAAADGYRLESLLLQGNGSVTARIGTVASRGTDPLGGVILREGLAAGARQVWLAATAASQWRTGWRAQRGGITAQSTPTIPPCELPRGWMRLQRFGDTVTLSVSPDGVAFTQVAQAEIPGLAEELHAGVFASNACVRLGDFACVPHQEALFAQAFVGGPAVASYVDDLSPGRALFNDISAQADGGAWSIDAQGRLSIARSNSPGAAGFLRYTPLEGAPGAVKVTFDVGFSNISEDKDLAVLEFGQFAPDSSYASSGPYGDITNWLVFKGKSGDGGFMLKYNGTSYGSYPGNGTTVRVTWVINRSAAALPYTGPDGSARTIAPNRAAIWAGTVPLALAAVPEAGFQSNALDKFRGRMLLADMTMILDNLEITHLLTANQPPTATNDTAVLDPQETVEIDLLANDADPDAGPSPLAITGISEPLHGQAHILPNGNVEYTPAAGYHGPDSFTYTVTDGRAVDWGVVTLQIDQLAFAQDFSAGTTLAAYFNAASPAAHQFNDISAEASGGAWSIDNGRLKLVRPTSSGSNTGAGLTRYADLPGATSLMRVEFDFSLAGVATPQDLVSIVVGNIAGFQDYNGTTPSGNTAFELVIKGLAANGYRLSVNGVIAGAFAADGSTARLVWYLNTTGAAQAYTGPDGHPYTVAHGCSSVWVNGVMLYHDQPRNAAHTNNFLRDIRMRMPSSQQMTLTLDNIIISRSL